MNNFRKSMFILIIILGVIILSFGIFFLVSGKKDKLQPYNETGLLNAAKKYYRINPYDLPQEEYDEVIITDKELINENLVTNDPENVLCNGYVSTTLVNGNYYYIPVVECNDQRDSTLLYKELIKHADTTRDGLYKDGDIYYFKGQNPDNYVSFNGLVWRIVEINENNEIRIVLNSTVDILSRNAWDIRYNIVQGQKVGINDYEFSNISITLDEWITNNKSFKSENLHKLAKHDLCIGARSSKDKTKDGSTECSKKLEGKLIGLLQANEYFRASLDENCLTKSNSSCQNYNFLNINTWTITASSENTYKAWYIFGGKGRIIDSISLDNYNRAYPVLNLKNSVSFSGGDGTANNPYKIK